MWPSIHAILLFTLTTTIVRFVGPTRTTDVKASPSYDIIQQGPPRKISVAALWPFHDAQNLVIRRVRSPLVLKCSLEDTPSASSKSSAHRFIGSWLLCKEFDMGGDRQTSLNYGAIQRSVGGASARSPFSPRWSSRLSYLSSEMLVLKALRSRAIETPGGSRKPI